MRLSEQVRELIENVADVFWLTNPNNTEMFYVSPSYARVFGRARAALYLDARDWLNAVHADDRAVVEAFADEPTVTERRMSYRVVHSDGSVHTVQIKLYPVRDATGEAVRIAGIAEDITERLELEEQVRQTQKMESLGLLAGGIAHDFNNVLAVIAANAELLEDTVPRTHVDRDLVDEIAQSVRRATSLTGQLMAFSRRQAVAPSVVDVNAVISETRKMLRRMIGDDMVLLISLEPELPPVHIDPGCLVQILMNLTVNARDAMGRGGKLTLSSRFVEATGEVMFSVTDSGCGMPETVRKRIFEPLFTTKGLGKGTGLGLSVVQGIVAQAHGRIEVESEVGHGTTLRIYLPKCDGEVVPYSQPAELDSRGNETVLLVDDDPFVRHALSRALTSRGYRVIEAPDGKAALALLPANAKTISLLVTDVVMPEMDGLELVAAARLEHPALPVLYISGYPDEAVSRHGIDRSTVSLLEKPFRGETLTTRVRHLLDAVTATAAP